jgi:hypothetical protein
MDSNIALQERVKFSERLKSSLLAAGLTTQPGEFTRAFNARADGAAITTHAARKWLMGESIPTHEKVVVLSVWLGVNAAWLRFGDDQPQGVVEEVLPEASISTPSLALLNDIHSLPIVAQQTIREIVDAFLKHYGHSDLAGDATKGRQA